MRRLPKFLRIGGLRIVISRVPNLSFDDGEGDHTHRAYGMFYPDALAIELDAGSGSEREKVTLVHETLHAILDTARVQMDHEDEESLVGRTAPLVLDFIRDNKGAIAYLQES